MLNLAAHVAFVSRGFPGLHTTCLKLVDSHPVPVYPIDPFRVTLFISLSPDARQRDMSALHVPCLASGVLYYSCMPLDPCRVTQRCPCLLFSLPFAGPFCNHVFNPMLVLSTNLAKPWNCWLRSSSPPKTVHASLSLMSDGFLPCAYRSMNIFSSNASLKSDSDKPLGT